MVADKKFMTCSAVARFLDVNRRTIDRYLEVDPSFPRPRITPRGRRQFLSSEIRAYEKAMRDAGQIRTIMIDGVEHDDLAGAATMFDLQARTIRILQVSGLISQPVEIQGKALYKVRDLQKIVDDERAAESTDAAA